jgi:murein L,D-transpeptidase YcbB/YkuD
MLIFLIYSSSKNLWLIIKTKKKVPVHLFKSIIFIILATALAVVLEAVTLSSVEKLDTTHSSFNKKSSNYKNYDKNISLSAIIYDEKSTKALMAFLITNEKKTFKNIPRKKFIQDVYQRKAYRPIWFTSQGIKKEAITDLFNNIKADDTLEDRGPIKKTYLRLKKKIATIKTRDLKMETSLDVELTSLYRSFMGHHLYGAIEWRSFKRKLSSLRRHKIAANWVTNDPKYDIAEMLLRYRISDVVARTTPSSFNYNALLNELSRLREVQRKGGWKKVPNSSQLRYGKKGRIVKQLTLRLQSEGDYTCRHRSKTYAYDNCLKKAVKRFQKRHGLGQSGSMNNSTRKKMNYSLNWKINKILLNLDRIKRLPDQAENRYIMVNIPEFRLYYRENGRDALTMRVVVGDKTHHTPIFSNKISFIVLNPYWLIPDSIVKKEMIPNILKNPNYLEQRGYEVRRSYRLSRPAINTSKIDWARVLRTGQTKRYKFMQPPGPKNALGKIKFKFPNQFAVYLHDTPAKKYFKKAVRAYSHGCIRIAQPRALLATFAKYERSVNYNRAKRILRGKKKTQLNLSSPVPVHIVYLTARVKSDGLLHYVRDVYGYDAKQHRTLH